MSILLTAILTQNFVLSQFLGICPFLGVSKKLNTAVGMSAAVIFVMALSTAVTYPYTISCWCRCDLAYLQTIVFILVIAALVQFVEIVLKKYMPALYSALGIYLPLITTNCAVLGVVLLNIDKGYGFAESMFNSVGAGLGFMLAMVIVRGRAGTHGILRHSEVYAGAAHHAGRGFARLGVLPRLHGHR